MKLDPTGSVSYNNMLRREKELLKSLEDIRTSHKPHSIMPDIEKLQTNDEIGLRLQESIHKCMNCQVKLSAKQSRFYRKDPEIYNALVKMERAQALSRVKIMPPSSGESASEAEEDGSKAEPGAKRTPEKDKTTEKKPGAQEKVIQDL